MATFTKRITASSDDCGGSNEGEWIYLASSNVSVFGDQDFFGLVGLRFTNVTIPQGATITSAKLTLTAFETESRTPTATATIAGIDEDNAAGFSGEDTGWTDLLTTRSLTAATVNWQPGAVVLDVEYDTSDFTSIVQEIIDRGGWSSGNAMAFRFRMNNTAGSYSKSFYSYDSSTTKAALLTVNYTVPADITIDVTNSLKQGVKIIG